MKACEIFQQISPSLGTEIIRYLRTDLKEVYRAAVTTLAQQKKLRPEFVQKMHDVCQIANYEPVDIVSPYLAQTKIEILADGLEMGLDYSKTWTCYNGREKACGKCGSCQERLEAFTLNHTTDPLPYE